MENRYADAFKELEMVDMPNRVKPDIKGVRSFALHNDDDIEDLKSFLDFNNELPEEDEITAVIDLNDDDELKDDYDDEKILKCPVCQTLITVDEVKPSDDEENELVNIDLECPECHHKGFEEEGKFKGDELVADNEDDKVNIDIIKPEDKEVEIEIKDEEENSDEEKVQESYKNNVIEEKADVTDQVIIKWVGLNECLKEDTVKQNGKWVNKGKEGTHGKFATKKAADKQRKAMFANGFHEDLAESKNSLTPEQAAEHVCKENGRVTILGNDKYLGADFFMRDGIIYACNAELGECDRQDWKEIDLLHHFERMQKEGFKFIATDNGEDTNKLHIDKYDFEENLGEGAEGKKVPGMEYVIYRIDLEEKEKAPIIAKRQTRVEAESLVNNINFGKNDKFKDIEVSFEEVPKGKFNVGDDFYGPFDSNFDKIQESKKLNEGPGAGYYVSGDIHVSDKDIQIINIKRDGDSSFLVDVDIVGEMKNINIEDYYNYGELEYSPIHIHEMEVTNYNGEEEPSIYDLKDILNETKIKHLFGGGYSHLTFDGKFDCDWKSLPGSDHYYGDFSLDRIYFEMTNKDDIDYLDECLTGEIEENLTIKKPDREIRKTVKDSIKYAASDKPADQADNVMDNLYRISTRTIKESLNEKKLEENQKKYEVVFLDDEGQVIEEKSKFFDDEDEAFNYAMDNNADHITWYYYKDEENEPSYSEEIWSRETESFDEGAFDKLINEFLEKTYENVDNYQTTSGSIDVKNNSIILEGLISFKSGNSKNTKFNFQIEHNKLVGLNETFSNNKDAFVLDCKLDNKNLIPQIINYNYSTSLNESVTGSVSLTERVNRNLYNTQYDYEPDEEVEYVFWDTFNSNKDDVKNAEKYNLKYEYMTVDGPVWSGKWKNLDDFCNEYLGYELHPDFLFSKDECEIVTPEELSDEDLNDFWRDINKKSQNDDGFDEMLDIVEAELDRRGLVINDEELINESIEKVEIETEAKLKTNSGDEIKIEVPSYAKFDIDDDKVKVIPECCGEQDEIDKEVEDDVDLGPVPDDEAEVFQDEEIVDDEDANKEIDAEFGVDEQEKNIQDVRDSQPKEEEHDSDSDSIVDDGDAEEEVNAEFGEEVKED